MMSLFFINQFAELNRHWYLPLNLPFYQEIEEVLSFHSSKLTTEQKEQISALHRQLLKKLETGFDGRPNVPGFIIIDEHNELFRMKGNPPQSPSDRHPDYFLPYCNWTIGGVSVMCGSAHSKFLANMPGGTGHTIRNLVPLTEQETVHYLLSPERPYSGPKNKLTEEADAKQLFKICGGVPRILFDACQALSNEPDSHLSAHEFPSIIEMKDRFRRFVDAIRDLGMFLKHVEAILFTDEEIPPHYSDQLMDPGLFYSFNRKVYFINDIAYQLVKQAYLAKVSRTSLAKLLDGTEKGKEFEKQVWWGLLESGTLEYRSLFHTGKDETEISMPISVYKIPEHYSYQMFPKNSFQNLVTPQPQGAHIFRPLSQNFPFVDFIIVDFDQPCVYLLQLTILDPNQHCNKSGDWKRFFQLNSLPPSETNALSSSSLQTNDLPPGKKTAGSEVTWSHLSAQVGLPPDTQVSYIYVTVQESFNLQSPPDNLPQNVEIGVMCLSSLHRLKILL
jgi:hypothetical protein